MNYSTGKFAKLANVTERTIRYYDKIGLLKPSFVMENGYRRYTQSDLLKLQKILSLKHMGFSLEEIYPMVSKEQNIKESFSMQIDLLDSQIKHLQVIRDSMESFVQNVDEKNIDWNQIISLLQMFDIESSIVEQYKNSNNLNVRISLHDQFSTNKTGWFNWLFNQIDFSKVNRLLEIGCGNGKLWENRNIDLRNREIFLSDISEGMINEVRKKLGKDYNCIVADCQYIPFKDGYFDAVIANHVLFYIQNLEKGLSEICRVLKDNGIFYCSTYGKEHMKEITELVQSFDSKVELSQNRLFDIFGIENGEKILKEYFKSVQFIPYEDSLIVNQAQPLVDYIMSCHGNQNEILGPKLRRFKSYVDDKIYKDKEITITKQAGLFICEK
ncbi:MAG: methyltransferase domain-containing protein [Erysipelotrichaceae bacterium]|uniref:Methyltransferase domain-containing protein n=1 Tax=Faecalicoccus pleomorphus TaxID=1323 RepID=A0A7X9NI55_9FIRM|nr:methyltransferase domain-containing protein [Faecalicoccus pleomorphus]MBE6119041.1 methyltransferase domain-containing protein [Erysipelotrichaceae bacterium]NME44256.1 methyltransferase domain-containing protein [Faecalicoccus pleomorphus]